MKLNEYLNSAGIAILPEIYSLNEMAFINERLNPIFKNKNSATRAYISSNDLVKYDLLDHVLTPRMIDVLFAAIDHPLFYHLHFYEIAANQKQPHIFGNTNSGWHRDTDSLYQTDSPSHLSLFVYFSDVGPTDGPFEFIQNYPEGPYLTELETTSITGSAGTSFIWHRHFFHRAAPNQATTRRRILKVSIQQNKFGSTHLDSGKFLNIIESRLPGENKRIDTLLGQFRDSTVDIVSDDQLRIPWRPA